MSNRPGQRRCLGCAQSIPTVARVAGNLEDLLAESMAFAEHIPEISRAAFALGCMTSGLRRSIAHLLGRCVACDKKARIDAEYSTRSEVAP